VPTQAQDEASSAPGADASLPSGVEVQTRGPVHEAFANPVVFNPKPGPIIPRKPPEPVQEQPPDQKPEGEDVQWIPGYWAWDSEREDFLWVSGLWRIPPPGRQWVPGYWSAAEGGYQWTPGAWTTAEREEIEYLPEPPRTLEAGPNVPQPSGRAVWSPGSWVWQGRRYVWRPGCWITAREDWLWVPPHYVWSPSGYLFIEGYWDYPVATRGILFAPVVIAPSVLMAPGFVYTPSYGIVTSAFSTNLFVRPGWGCYYFGDYYASTYLSVGIFPWFQFQYSRVGFDPFYAHAFALNVGINPGWAASVQNNYIFLRNHAPARPPRTLVAQRNITVNRTVNVNNTIIQNGVQNQAVIAQPISELGREGGGGGRGMRLERVAAERRAIYAQRQEQLHELRLARIERETSLARERGEMARSRADMVESRSEVAQARQGAAAARAEAAGQAAQAKARIAEARSERVVSARLPRSPISSPRADAAVGGEAAGGGGPGRSETARRVARGVPPPPPTDAALGGPGRPTPGRVGSMARRADDAGAGTNRPRPEAGRALGAGLAGRTTEARATAPRRMDANSRPMRGESPAEGAADPPARRDGGNPGASPRAAAPGEASPPAVARRMGEPGMTPRPGPGMRAGTGSGPRNGTVGMGMRAAPGMRGPQLSGGRSAAAQRVPQGRGGAGRAARPGEGPSRGEP
jgi:hypothetical protein